MSRRSEGGGPQVSLQVVERLAQILSMFSPERRELRVADVARELRLQRPTAYRYMASLARVGLLQRNEDGLSYSLGPLPIQLGTIALGGLNVVDRAAPYMQRLANEVHQTVVLSLWGGHGPVVVRHHEDVTRQVQILVRPGSTLALDTAQGHVFLAYLPDRALVARLISGFGESQRRDLESQIERVRTEGIAIKSLYSEGLRAIAAPVFNEQGVIAAAMAIVGTSATISDDPTSGFVSALRQTAQELSMALGCVAVSRGW